MRKLMFILMALGLFLLSFASMPGYCYSDLVAQKTVDVISNNNSALQIGLGPGAETTLVIGVAAGSGIIAGIEAHYSGIFTYNLVKVSNIRLIVNINPDKGIGFGQVDEALEMLRSGSKDGSISEVIWTVESNDKLQVHRSRLIDSKVRDEIIDSVPPQYDEEFIPVRSIFKESMVSAAVVIASAGCIYLWWSST
jgi:hypothetical protein